MRYGLQILSPTTSSLLRVEQRQGHDLNPDTQNRKTHVFGFSTRERSQDLRRYSFNIAILTSYSSTIVCQRYKKKTISDTVTRIQEKNPLRPAPVIAISDFSFSTNTSTILYQLDDQIPPRHRTPAARILSYNG
jgi:hypothetical protein